MCVCSQRCASVQSADLAISLPGRRNRGGTEEEEEGEVDVGQVVLRTEIICGVQVRERNIMGRRWKMQDALSSMQREDYLGA